MSPEECGVYEADLVDPAVRVAGPAAI